MYTQSRGRNAAASFLPPVCHRRAALICNTVPRAARCRRRQQVLIERITTGRHATATAWRRVPVPRCYCSPAVQCVKRYGRLSNDGEWRVRKMKWAQDEACVKCAAREEP